MLPRKLFHQLANFLTISRLVIALSIPIIGTYFGKKTIVNPVGYLFLIAFATDLLDGHISRATNKPKSKFWTFTDGFADLVLALCLFAFLLTINLIPTHIFLIVTILVITTAVVDQIIFQGIAIFTLITTYLIFAFMHYPNFIITFTIFLAFVFIFFHKRFITLNRRFFDRLKQVGKKPL